MDHINDYIHVNHLDLDIKPVPEQVLYINELDITGGFCGGGCSGQPYARRAALMKHNGETASRYAKKNLISQERSQDNRFEALFE